MPAPPLPAAERALVTYGLTNGEQPVGHDRQSRTNVARRLAEVMDWRFCGDYQDAQPQRALYFVPHDVLLLHDAHRLGIRTPQQLFGGVVPYSFIATKAITHPLIGPDAIAPRGWSHAFQAYAGDTVLRGFTTFSRDDASHAARVLLRQGPARIKCVSGIGGAGQYVAETDDDAERTLDSIASDEFETAGVAVEEHLAESVTFSVGHVECGSMTIAYCGTQQTTVNARGHQVYGGSTLDVVRGGFDALLASDLSPERRVAVELACAYDAAAFGAYADAFASRRNYDVLFGRDGNGRPRAGVLEQSWRIGGASAAEVIALDAFKRDPARSKVTCATVEKYDDRCDIPAGAFVYYRGVDARVGSLTKYAVEIDGPNT